MIKSAISIGNFDGVHRGHQALIHALIDWRRKQSEPIKTIAVTFHPHPREILNPTAKVPQLCRLEDRVKLLESMGIDEVRVIPFTSAYAETRARSFFEQVLLANLNAAFIAVGSNFYFGKNREGSPEKIIEWCREKNIESLLLPPIEADGEIVSSTRIRELIQKGELRPASRLLGRPFFLSGMVQHGHKRGSGIGFPTANIYPATSGVGSLCLPPNGVYLTTTTIEDGRTFASVSNLGVRPTVHLESPVVLESHLLDFEGDLYGKFVTVEFQDSIRAEMKFPSIEALRQQIQIDIDLAKQKLQAK